MLGAFAACCAMRGIATLKFEGNNGTEANRSKFMVQDGPSGSSIQLMATGSPSNDAVAQILALASSGTMVAERQCNIMQFSLKSGTNRRGTNPCSARRCVLCLVDFCRGSSVLKLLLAHGSRGSRWLQNKILWSLGCRMLLATKVSEVGRRGWLHAARLLLTCSSFQLYTCLWSESEWQQVVVILRCSNRIGLNTTWLSVPVTPKIPW